MSPLPTLLGFPLTRLAELNCVCVAAWELYSNIYEAKDAMQAFWEKEEADTSPATAENIVNKRIAVYWTYGAKGWYNGTIISINEESSEAEIRYDDGSEDCIPLDHRLDEEGYREQWPWKRGEYTKLGKRKPPNVSAD